MKYKIGDKVIINIPNKYYNYYGHVTGDIDIIVDVFEHVEDYKYMVTLKNRKSNMYPYVMYKEDYLLSYRLYKLNRIL